VSRDQTAKIWAGNASAKLVATIDLPNPATAVAFAPKMASAQGYVLAVGEEDGRISLWRGGVEGKWEQSMVIPAHLGHVSVVRRLRWQINHTGKGEDEKEKGNDNRFLLATCSYDWSVRLFSLTIP
jgi:WD40 repeat protein